MKTQLTTIRAPYNFVPLNETIYFPEWADEISHDIPFSDGQSGIIDMTIKAETPIFIRNGSNESDEQDFSNLTLPNGKKQFFIPGTSIKGMIRNVMEVISFGKMQFVDNRRYTWRDLIDAYTTKFVSGFDSPPKVKAAFIQEVDGQWCLFPCDFARIEQCHLHPDIGVKFLSAKQKYGFWEERMGKKLQNYFTIGEPGTDVFEKQCGEFRKAELSKTDSGTKGQIVFTGQIKKRNKGGEGEHGDHNKHLEFVFFNEQTSYITIDDQMRRDFELNHSDERNKAKHKAALSPNEEWGRWKNVLQNGGKMPVFWLGSVSSNTIESFGMAMLYRLPLKYSVYDKIKKTNRDHIKHIEDSGFNVDEFVPDLTDCMFGYSIASKKGKSKSLKGRVQFSHALCNSLEPEIQDCQHEILSSPKPTFYPTYLKNGNYNNDNSFLSGRKRYPIHNKIMKYEYVDQDILNRVGTKFKPLDKGTEFHCKVRFHNLRKVEIGALMTAITFYNHHDKFYHSLGMAKPLGYGSVNISVNNITSKKNCNDVETPDLSIDTMKDYMDDFINEIEDNTGIVWRKDKSIIELLTMASIQKNNANTESWLRYMVMDTKGENEFKEVKGNKQTLKYYSEIKNGIIPKKIIVQEDLHDIVQRFDRSEIEEVINSDPGFKQEIIAILSEQEDTPPGIYESFLYDPKILLKYLNSLDTKNKNTFNRQLREILNNRIRNFQYQKNESETQEVFDFILKNKYNNEIPDQFTNAEKKFMYSWSDLFDKVTQDDILDLFDNARLWPPMSELKEYIKNSDLEDKETLLELYEQTFS